MRPPEAGVWPAARTDRRASARAHKRTDARTDAQTDGRFASKKCRCGRAPVWPRPRGGASLASVARASDVIGGRSIEPAQFSGAESISWRQINPLCFLLLAPRERLARPLARQPAAIPVSLARPKSLNESRGVESLFGAQENSAKASERASEPPAPTADVFICHARAARAGPSRARLAPEPS